jgi:hypothetical protein
MVTLILGMVFTVMAMLAAIIGIGITEAYLRRSAKTKRDIEDGYGTNRRSA